MIEGDETIEGMMDEPMAASAQHDLATDPVCGMRVDPDEAPAKAEYQREQFYFCSIDCRQKFEQDPDRHARRTA